MAPAAAAAAAGPTHLADAALSRAFGSFGGWCRAGGFGSGGYTGGFGGGGGQLPSLREGVQSAPNSTPMLTLC